LILYRISNHSDLSGLGGELADGRWHTREKGRRVVYTSDHPALCILEILVHVKIEDLPDDYQLLRIEVPDVHIVPVEDKFTLPDDWAVRMDSTQLAGDDWLTSELTAGMSVPSVLAPIARNCLLNPKVAAVAALKAEIIGRFPFDQRLAKRHA